jgi:nucleolar protein 56
MDLNKKNALRNKLIKKTRAEIEEGLAGKEVHIIKAIRLVDALDEINNTLNENILEWEKRNPYEKALSMITVLKQNQKSVEVEREELVEFIKEEMNDELENFSQIATPVLGARLLASAGSKKRLAFMPSSTMQLLGAEKALFNHLKKKADSPKHGHLFNHPLLQKLPKNKRGKAARIIAGKLSIAAKVDYFGTKSKLNLLKEVEEKINKL